MPNADPEDETGIADEVPPEDNLDVDMVDDELNQDVPPQMGPPQIGPDGQPMPMDNPSMGVPAAPDPLMGQNKSPMRQFMQDLMKKYQTKYMDDDGQKYMDVNDEEQGPEQGPQGGEEKVYPGFAADLARRMASEQK